MGAHGCTHESHLADLDDSKLEQVNAMLKEIPDIKLSTRRRIRAALRSHYAVLDGVEAGGGAEQQEEDGEVQQEEDGEVQQLEVEAEVLPSQEQLEEVQDRSGLQIPLVTLVEDDDEEDPDIITVLDDDEEENGNEQEEQAAGNADDISIQQWLDNIKSGYGERFGHLLEAHGCAHESHLADLDDSKLE